MPDIISGASRPLFLDVELLVAKPNYSFQKRQKDLAKKAKKEEKKLRKLNRANEAAQPEPELPLQGTEPAEPS